MTPHAGYIDRVLAGYEAAAPDLIAPYEALKTLDVLGLVIGCLPDTPGDVLDLGAGTGRDAAWLAMRGHRVTAVEPVSAFREAGRDRHPDLSIRWLDDRLPDMPTLRAQTAGFDLILGLGVWHHLTSSDQRLALQQSARLVRPGGQIILSLRHGPAPTDRPGHGIDTNGLVAHAQRVGLQPVDQKMGLPSIQMGNRKVGVTWDWVVFGLELSVGQCPQIPDTGW